MKKWNFIIIMMLSVIPLSGIALEKNTLSDPKNLYFIHVKQILPILLQIPEGNINDLEEIVDEDEDNTQDTEVIDQEESLSEEESAPNPYDFIFKECYALIVSPFKDAKITDLELNNYKKFFFPDLTAINKMIKNIESAVKELELSNKKDELNLLKLEAYLRLLKELKTLKW